MKTVFVAVAVCLVWVFNAAAQWSAPGQNASYNSGNVGIGLGTTVPVSLLEVQGNQGAQSTTSSAKFGTYEIQSYAVNNAWLSDNIYYNALNGGFRYRSTGFGV